MSIALRNVDFDLDSDPRSWPFEALVTVLERGLVPDWRPIVQAITQQPWGEFPRRVTKATQMADDPRLEVLFSLVIDDARHQREHEEREEVAARVRTAIAHSGLTQAQFAREIGTSASRLSTYATGSVTPSAALLLRIEQVSATLAARGTPRTRS